MRALQATLGTATSNTRFVIRSRRPTGSKTFGADKAHLSKPGMLYRRKRDFEAASAFVLFKRSVALFSRCVRSRISSSGLLRVFQRRHCS